MVMLRDSAHLKKSAGEKSVFEDLGALTASIEHEIKVPLQISNNTIAKMKARYQAQSDIVARLAELERQNNRIFAATEIIETLRGGNAYYDSSFVREKLKESYSETGRPSIDPELLLRILDRK